MPFIHDSCDAPYIKIPLFPRTTHGRQKTQAMPDTFPTVVKNISMCQTVLFWCTQIRLSIGVFDDESNKKKLELAFESCFLFIIPRSVLRASLLGCTHSPSFPAYGPAFVRDQLPLQKLYIIFPTVLLGFPQQGKLEEFLLNDKFTVFSQMTDLQFGGGNRLLIPLTVCLSVACRRKGHDGSAVVISLPLI